MQAKSSVIKDAIIIVVLGFMVGIFLYAIAPQSNPDLDWGIGVIFALILLIVIRTALKSKTSK